MDLSGQPSALSKEDGMIGEMVETLIRQIPEKYPHIRHPQVLRARVTGAEEDGQWEEPARIRDALGDREGTMIRKQYRYVVQIMDEQGNRDEDFPVIPSVMSRMYIPVGSMVAVALMQGVPDLYILGVCR